jgi:RecA-family ATPase
MESSSQVSYTNIFVNEQRTVCFQSEMISYHHHPAKGGGGGGGGEEEEEGEEGEGKEMTG